MGVSAKRIMNGTFGELWLNGEKVAECYGLQAKTTFNKEEINQCGDLAVDSKITSIKNTGSMKLNKVFSRMASALTESISTGTDVRFTIISKLADPDAYGAERIALYDVSFDDLTLADWEAKKAGTVECPFTFIRAEFLDKTEVQ